MNRKGQGLVEYALIIVFLAIAVVAAVAIFGSSLLGLYSSITSSIAGAGS